PPGDLVLFLYQPFGRPALTRLIAAIERGAAEPRAIFIIYDNPVHGALFDTSPALRRRWAHNVPCAYEERGYGGSLEEAVIIWQAGAAPPPSESTEATIVLSNADSLAELRFDGAIRR